jgi:hypothetical protein
VLCCAVLCCAVLFCAVLCCVVLCCAVLCCVVLCCAGLGWDGPGAGLGWAVFVGCVGCLWSDFECYKPLALAFLLYLALVVLCSFSLSRAE